MTDRELMQMALDALEDIGDEWGFTSQRTLPKRMNVIEALRAQLSQPEPEPVATVYDAYDTTGIDWHCKDAPATGTKLYTAPPQREWQGLTENEIKHLWYEACQTNLELTSQLIVHLARNIETKLKEMNSA